MRVRQWKTVNPLRTAFLIKLSGESSSEALASGKAAGSASSIQLFKNQAVETRMPKRALASAANKPKENCRAR